MNILTLLKYSGAPGLLIVVFGALLLFKLVGTVFREDSPSLVPYVVGAGALLGIGLLGTGLGLYSIQQTIAASPTAPTPAQLASGRMQAFTTTLLGGGAATLILALAGLIGFARRRRPVEGEALKPLSA